LQQVFTLCTKHINHQQLFKGTAILENILRIIKGCIDKEHKCQKLVYEKYYGYALKIVFRYIYRYDNAADVTNDGFVKLFRYFDRFVPDEDGNHEHKLMGWLKRIMINTAVDALRKDSLMPETGGIPDHVWNITSNSADADQAMLYKELITLVKELPPQYRMVFNLYIIDGYNHFEVADVLKISVGTSKSALSRARQLLQNKISKTQETRLCII
jgi:RNA polymerase sigma factor (sigma-70 family)